MNPDASRNGDLKSLKKVTPQIIRSQRFAQPKLNIVRLAVGYNSSSAFPYDSGTILQPHGQYYIPFPDLFPQCSHISRSL